MLGRDPDTSISGLRVARELTDLIARRGKPGMIVSDNGTEFTSHAIFAWTKDHAWAKENGLRNTFGWVATRRNS